MCWRVNSQLLSSSCVVNCSKISSRIQSPIMIPFISRHKACLPIFIALECKSTVLDTPRSARGQECVSRMLHIPVYVDLLVCGFMFGRSTVDFATTSMCATLLMWFFALDWLVSSGPKQWSYITYWNEVTSNIRETILSPRWCFQKCTLNSFCIGIFSPFWWHENPLGWLLDWLFKYGQAYEDADMF